MSHIPVLLQEVISFLDPQPGKKFIDATVGEGGHLKSLLEGGAEVLGIDVDDSVVTKLCAECKVQNVKRKIVQGNYTDIRVIAKENGFSEVDGIMFDLGLGSHQLDDEVRGFSFQKTGPLDMRFDRNSKLREKTAADLVNGLSERELTQIFFKYGEEKRFGKKIARAIAETRKYKFLETTTDLFELIKKALPGKFRFQSGDVTRRIFQGLRIAVNHELENLEKALPQAFALLRKGGRLVVISFHSLEDRIVKDFFRELARTCVCPPDFPVCKCRKRPLLRILTKKPVVPSEFETKTNSRSRSAKLRAAEKL